MVTGRPGSRPTPSRRANYGFSLHFRPEGPYFGVPLFGFVSLKPFRYNYLPPRCILVNANKTFTIYYNRNH
jgi:hypothetical protein